LLIATCVNCPVKSLITAGVELMVNETLHVSLGPKYAVLLVPALNVPDMLKVSGPADPRAPAKINKPKLFSIHSPRSGCSGARSREAFLKERRKAEGYFAPD
jgi:hypothetical protein